MNHKVKFLSLPEDFKDGIKFAQYNFSTFRALNSMQLVQVSGTTDLFIAQFCNSGGFMFLLEECEASFQQSGFPFEVLWSADLPDYIYQSIVECEKIKDFRIFKTLCELARQRKKNAGVSIQLSFKELGQITSNNISKELRSKLNQYADKEYE